MTIMEAFRAYAHSLPPTAMTAPAVFFAGAAAMAEIFANGRAGAVDEIRLLREEIAKGNRAE